MQDDYNYKPDSYEQDDSVFSGAQPIIYATTGQRFVNFLIDFIAVYACTFLFFFIMGALFPEIFAAMFSDPDSLRSIILDRILTAMVFVVIYTIVEGATKGRSLGKLITNTQAVTEDGATISWKNALLRSLSRIVPLEVFSGFSGHPWHDTWTKTMVIQRSPRL